MENSFEIGSRLEKDVLALRDLTDNLHILSEGMDVEVDWKIKRNAIMVIVERQREIYDDLKEVTNLIMEK